MRLAAWRETTRYFRDKLSIRLKARETAAQALVPFTPVAPPKPAGLLTMIHRLLLFLRIAASCFAQTATRALIILHCNDLHARFLPDSRNLGGFAEYATVIRRQTAGCKSCIVMNAGDLVQGSPMSTIFRGVPVYQVANKLGIQVSTLGNHEFDYG